MLITAGQRSRKPALSTCMYLARITSSMPFSASSARWASSASTRLAALTGRCTKGMANPSATPRRSAWLLTTSATSIGSSPERVRQRRSTRQWS